MPSGAPSPSPSGMNAKLWMVSPSRPAPPAPPPSKKMSTVSLGDAPKVPT
jgi:hypothetical protein